MFQTQFTELCTIIPEHFTVMPGLYKGTRALSLIEPVLAQKVGLFSAEGETVMPMAAAIVGIVQELNKTGELRMRSGRYVRYRDEAAADQGSLAFQRTPRRRARTSEIAARPRTGASVSNRADTSPYPPMPTAATKARRGGRVCPPTTSGLTQHRLRCCHLPALLR